MPEQDKPFPPYQPPPENPEKVSREINEGFRRLSEEASTVSMREMKEREMKERAEEAEEDKLNRERQKRYGPGPTGKGPESFKDAMKIGDTEDSLSIDEQLRQQGATADETTRASLFADKSLGKSGNLPLGLTVSDDGPPPRDLDINKIGEMAREAASAELAGLDDDPLEPSEEEIAHAVQADIDRKAKQAEVFAQKFAAVERGQLDKYPDPPPMTIHQDELTPPVGRNPAPPDLGPEAQANAETILKKAAQCGNNDPEVAAILAGHDVIVGDEDSPEVRRIILKQELPDADSTALDLLSMASYRADALTKPLTLTGEDGIDERVWEAAFMKSLSNACAFNVTPAEFCAEMLDVIALGLLAVDVSHPAFFKSILIEFAYKMDKWGTDFDRQNTPNDWVSYIIRYYSRAILAENAEDTVNGFVKLAALGYAGAIATKRLGGPAPRHYDKVAADPKPLVEKDEREKGRQKFGPDGVTPIAR